MIKHPRRVEEEVLTTLSAWSPMCARDYAELTGLAYNVAWDRLARLNRAGLIHIDHWQRRRSGKHTPFFAIGTLSDAPPLPVLTQQEKSARYRASEKGKAAYAKAARRRRKREKLRRKNDPAWAERMRAYGREWCRKKHGHKPRRAIVAVEKFDPLLAALMGIKPKRVRRKTGGEHA